MKLTSRCRILVYLIHMTQIKGKNLKKINLFRYNK